MRSWVRTLRHPCAVVNFLQGSLYCLTGEKWRFGKSPTHKESVARENVPENCRTTVVGGSAEVGEARRFSSHRAIGHLNYAYSAELIQRHTDSKAIILLDRSARKKHTGICSCTGVTKLQRLTRMTQQIWYLCTQAVLRQGTLSQPLQNRTNPLEFVPGFMSEVMRTTILNFCSTFADVLDRCLRCEQSLTTDRLSSSRCQDLDAAICSSDSTNSK